MSNRHPAAPHRLPRILLIGYLSAAASVTAAQTSGPPLVLESLSTRDGLPQGDVLTTLQDSQGFIWIGTEDGLVRYDGYEIHRYSYSANATNGLPGNFVDGIAEDAQSDLWIALKGSGVAHWHRATDTFTVYHHDPANPQSLSSDAARTLLIDRTGTIWIGSADAGVDVLEPATGHIRHLHHDPDQPDSLANDQVQTLLQDRTGSIWIGTRSGLDRVWANHGGVTHYSLQSETPAPQTEQVSQIIEDTAGGFWVGTFNAGLYQLDSNGRVIDHFRHDVTQPASLSHDDVRAVLSDHAGHLWVGTPEGLDLLNRSTGKFTHYTHDKADPDSLRDSFIMSLYQDTSGLVWIGTRAGGVSRWNPHSWELGGRNPDWLNGKLVTAFADAPGGRLWIGSVGGGLMRFDSTSGEVVDIDTILSQPGALGDRRVMSLLTDHRGALWIGTMASGLKKLADGKITAIAVRAGDPHALSSAGIMAIFESHNGKLWIGTHGGGANVLDPATGLVQQLPFNSKVPGALSGENITSFLEDNQGNVWIGTDSGGLNLARSDGSVLEVFKHDPRDPGSLSANTIYSMTTDAAGRIWIATDGGGLDLVIGSSAHPESVRFTNISSANGLSSDTIYGVLPDSSGYLWLSGNAGLMRFDPTTRTVKTYHREHGLQGEEFDSGASFRSRDQRLCFGGPGGFNIFDPSRLTEKRTPPRQALTHLEVLGAPVHSPTPYWLMKDIHLGYRANIVSLDFAALDFTAPSRNQLEYRMAGLTEDWINLGNLRRVTLTNLDSGDHFLEVRAVNGDSVWSTTPLRIAIHKESAPWRSGPAYAVYAFTLLAVVLLALRAQRNKLSGALAAQQRLESEVAVQTQELREINRQLVAASEAKGAFLARMSHELRTPMNGVVGMTELLARTPLSPAQARHTRAIQSSAQTLLQILNDLLDLSKVQVGKIELEQLPVDLVQIIEECAALFSGAAQTKGLDLIVCPPRGTPWQLIGDPLRIRQILMNLIGNAIKFTERGEIVLTCDITADNTTEALVQLSVADTGIGISDTAMVRIFEPFTQADETTTRRFGGTGLGLAISQEFTELMGGTMEVKSVPQVGSTFSISLRLKIAAPLQKDDLLVRTASIKILTRRHAIGASLERYLTAFGATHVRQLQNLGELQRDAADIVLLDADSFADAIKAGALPWPPAPDNARLIVIAAPDVVEALGIASRVRPGQLVRKPFARDALKDALKSALQDFHAPRPAQPGQPAQLPPQQGHVLIVEDDPVNAAVAAGYLVELGCTSVWVETGVKAISTVAAQRFDLVLMDLNMPGLDGYATASLIRKAEPRGRNIPIVALTANHAAAHRDACLLAGMDDILGKPYSLEQFAEILRRWIAHPEQTRSGAEKWADAPVELASVDPATVENLRRIRGPGRSDLYGELVTIFTQSSKEDLERLRHALEDSDLTDARRLCHKLKGSAGNVGALAFADSVEALEHACGANDLQGAWPLFESLSSAHLLLISQLDEYRQQVPA